MINSRKLEDLLPPVRERAEAFKAKCALEGIEVIFTSTYRDNESQNELFAQGRTKLGPNPTPSRPMGRRVTNARGGDSMHNHRVAFDFCPIVNGKAMWDDKALFKRCGEIAESVGLDWSGRWTQFPEMAHCQYTGGLTLADLKAGKQPK